MNDNEKIDLIKKLKKDDNKYVSIIKELEPVFKKIGLSQELTAEKKDFRNYDNKYSFMVTVKLQSILRKKALLNLNEIDLLYSDYDYLHKKMDEIYDLVSCITVDNSIPYIIDKQTVCAYLRISINDYQMFFENDLYDKNIQNEFKSMEDFLVSMYQQSAENNLRNASAVKYRLGLKNQFGGNQVEEHIAENKKTNKDLFDENEIKNRLKNYNFNDNKKTKVISESNS